MAKKPAAVAAKGGKGAAKGGKKRGGKSIGYLIIGVLLVMFFMPTAIFLAVALLPSFVALVVDRNPRRYGGFTVGGLNLAGSAPYLMQLWSGSNTIDGALAQISQVFHLVVIYGAAAMGWMLYGATPSVVATFLTLTAGRRLAVLVAKQKSLIEDWGMEVTTTAVTPAGATGGVAPLGADSDEKESEAAD